MAASNNHRNDAASVAELPQSQPQTLPPPAPTQRRSQKFKLPVDDSGLMPVEWSVDTAPEAVAGRTSFSPWARLWRMFDQLEIADTDTTAGRQQVKAGFSPWAFVALESLELIRSARGSLKGYADTHREEYLAQMQTTAAGFYVRKMRPELWDQRSKA